MPLLCDVVAVNIKTNKVRILETRKSPSNAEAIVNMAVMRRGCEVEFFSEVPHGMYRNDDPWIGDGGQP